MFPWEQVLLIKILIEQINYGILAGCFHFAAYNIVKNKFSRGLGFMFHFNIWSDFKFAWY